MTKPIMILATDGFEQSELMKPKANLEAAGFETTVVSLESGSIRGWNEKDWGDTVNVDATVDDVNSKDFAGIVLPGGQINPDMLRMNKEAVKLVRSFAESNKPVAAICHGPWMLAEADVIRGKTVTSWPSIRTDLRNAGANVVDKEVQQDANIITSRNPDDIPAFSEALINTLNQEKLSKAA
ncbi:type 1 glutamine amidotransferase [Altericroceibacterium spongiae]|uniref:Type 1 glutamine amidotransferase n=1 Tax=Altericroceibacterium spongiae TaxID=2320269 RepID=A0A420EML3_9SPHN|nr:type 1 glutamine amidotransferase domain-containing protein [Altericroceibacterium spongiae]RKF21928.1 type 1 glutamine amidotransferase [Altericroceibacterium spongiae]